MKTRTLLLLAVTIALIAGLSTAALAGPKENPGKPGRPTTTTTTTVPEPTTLPGDGLTTCLDVGPAWNLGTWDSMQQVYTAETLPICIDLNADELHQGLTQWTLTWTGTSARPTKRGAEAILMFEEQVHTNAYATREIALADLADSGTGTWEAHLDFAATEPRSLVFVAMPHSGAKWTSFTVTLEPITP